jgi:hypothetical protein
MPVHVHPIDAAFEPLIGLPSWSVMKGRGSFVTMEFGDPELTIGEERPHRLNIDGVDPRTVMKRHTVVHGAWHLFIYCCLWRLETDGVEIAHCELDDVTIARALGILNGQALTSVEVDPRTGGSKFTFDLGGVLFTHPAPAGSYDDEPVEQWMLYQPSGTVLTVRGDGCYAVEPADVSDESATWRPLPEG